ncbi:MAG TPA: hypothetical protein VFK33_10225 [Bacillales bacterium]|nr:hypothetical protein [Bacillales bacterium]
MANRNDEWLRKISDFLQEHDLKEVKIKGKDQDGEKHKFKIRDEEDQGEIEGIAEVNVEAAETKAAETDAEDTENDED